MKIRNRLTIGFAVIASLILVVASIFIYVFSSEYRKDDFYQRMVNKGTNSAKLLIEVEEIDASMLRRIEKDNPSNLPLEKILIFDYKNQLLYSSDTESEILASTELLNQVRLKQQVRYDFGELEAVGFLFTDQYDRFAVIVAARDIYGLKKLSNLFRVLLIVCAGGILMVIMGGWIFSSQAIKPIQRVIADVKKIGINNLDLRVSEGNGKDEIAQLAANFNNMLMRLEEAFNLQKNFIANASHELRTPLTIISGEIEVLLRKERNANEYLSTLQSVYDEMTTLNKVSNQLLMLAQTSSERRDQAIQEVRCDEVIWQVRTEMQKIYSDATIEVQMSVDDGEAFNYAISGNPYLLKTVFLNLVENAIKYSPDQKVVIQIYSNTEVLNINFNNIQVGLEDRDVKLMLEPFYRGNNASGKKGNGLGLSLVKNIMDRHNGQLKLSLVDGQLRVELQFYLD